MNGTFRIYELPEGHENKGESYESLQRKGVSLNALDYKLVYEGSLSDLAEFEKSGLPVSSVLVVKPDGMKSQAYYRNEDCQFTMPEFFLDEKTSLKAIVEQFMENSTLNEVESPDGEWHIEYINRDLIGRISHNGEVFCDIVDVGDGFEILPANENITVAEIVQNTIESNGNTILNSTDLSILFLKKELEKLRQEVAELKKENEELRQQLVPFTAERIRYGLKDMEFGQARINSIAGTVCQVIRLDVSDRLLKELVEKTPSLRERGDNYLEAVKCQIVINQEDNSLQMLLYYDYNVAEDDLPLSSHVPLTKVEEKAVYQAVDSLYTEKNGKSLEETFAGMVQYATKQRAEETKVKKGDAER